MADFSFISRCGKCSDNPLGNSLINVDCDNDTGKCCIDISVDSTSGTKRISCDSADGIVDCIWNPDRTYVGGVLQATPTRGLVQPLEVFQTAMKIVDPWG